MVACTEELLINPGTGKIDLVRRPLAIALAFEIELFVIATIPLLTYVLAFTPITDSEIVFLNGVGQLKGAGESYTLSGATVTFAADAKLRKTDKIQVHYARITP